ncbi:MAG: photosystem II stability/assembly factor-like uncharacterized protein [Pseudohongiellaceae bacterium]|jgi:photosystem II stability/assembly factor-like uncharacterized protein
MTRRPTCPPSRWLASLALATTMLCSCAQRPIPTHHVPPVDSTQVILGDQSYKQERKSFVRERHWASPDTDWKAIERRNGHEQIAKRNALASLWAGAGSRWTERGSDNQAGRMHVAVPGPDGNTLYAGSSLGGIWQGGLGGTNWTPLGDNLAGGAHWLAVVAGASPTDPDIIVAATDGGEIHRSTDGGQTWTVPAGLPATVGVRRMLVPADGNDTIFIVARWWNGSSLKNTVYRSTDKGATFSKAIGMNTYTGDIWTARDGPGPLYMLKQDTLQISHDGGNTWAVLSDLPGNASGGELVGCEAGAPRLWAILDEGGETLYRSDDGGLSWNMVTAVSDYWGTLNASIIDPDLFAWGGVEVHVTSNAGASFSKVNNWYDYYGNEANKLHADIPGIDVVPNGPGAETWYVSTDGGLFQSTDGLATVENLSLLGLRVSQYYSTHTSTANPDRVIAGAQDQGYQRADAAPIGTTALSFDQLISGDYGHIVSGDGSHAWVYSCYPGFILVQKGATSPQLFQVDFPPNANYGWLPTVTADPWDNQRWFFCADKLYRYTKQLFNSWTSAEWSTQNFAQSSGEYLTAMQFSPANTNRAYAATNQGKLWWSDDHGKTWTQSTSNGPSAHYFYGTAMVCDASDPDTVWVGGSGYSGPAVYRSTDGGVTFSPWGQGLPSTLVYSMAQAPDGSGDVYCGTELAAWRRGANDASWTDITANDAPVTTYWSVEAVPSANVMRFGTYGRGIWDYDVDDGCVWEAYGLNAGGANVLTLDTRSSTVNGNPMTFDVGGALPSASGFMLVSTATAQQPFKMGTLLVDPTGWLLIAVAADSQGQLQVPLTVPTAAGLDGLPVALQMAMSDPSQGANWAFSNGLSGVLCD